MYWLLALCCVFVIYVAIQFYYYQKLVKHIDVINEFFDNTNYCLEFHYKNQTDLILKFLSHFNGIVLSYNDTYHLYLSYFSAWKLYSKMKNNTKLMNYFYFNEYSVEN